MLGRPEPRRFEPFYAVDLDNGVYLRSGRTLP
jgi:hypothetical protein